MCWELERFDGQDGYVAVLPILADDQKHYRGRSFSASAPTSKLMGTVGWRWFDRGQQTGVASPYSRHQTQPPAIAAGAGVRGSRGAAPSRTGGSGKPIVPFHLKVARVGPGTLACGLGSRFFRLVDPASCLSRWSGRRPTDATSSLGDWFGWLMRSKSFRSDLGQCRPSLGSNLMRRDAESALPRAATRNKIPASAHRRVSLAWLGMMKSRILSKPHAPSPGPTGWR
jgi:hypothetical protein